MTSDNETFDEVFAEAMNRKAVRDYRNGVSNGMKLGVVRCVEDVVDHYAMRFRDAKNVRSRNSLKSATLKSSDGQLSKSLYRNCGSAWRRL